MAGIALNHHASGLEDGVGDLGNGELLMVRLLGRDDLFFFFLNTELTNCQIEMTETEKIFFKNNSDIDRKK